MKKESKKRLAWLLLIIIPNLSYSLTPINPIQYDGRVKLMADERNVRQSDDSPDCVACNKSHKMKRDYPTVMAWVNSPYIIKNRHKTQQSGLLGLDDPFCSAYQHGPLLPDLTTPPTLDQLVQQAANRYHIDSSLVCAIIKHESAWNPNVVSSAGAIGLMQIIPSTGQGACGLTEAQLYNPSKNIECGVSYFSQQLKRFGSEELALCAYNAGPHRIVNGKCPPFQETNTYKQRVLSTWRSGQTCPQKTFQNRPKLEPILTPFSAKGIADARFIVGLYEPKEWWTLICEGIEAVYNRETAMIDRATILTATVNDIYRDEVRLKGNKGWSKSRIRKRINQACSKRQNNLF